MPTYAESEVEQSRLLENQQSHGFPLLQFAISNLQNIVRFSSDIHQYSAEEKDHFKNSYVKHIDCHLLTPTQHRHTGHHRPNQNM
jgi:hypothetical protein